MKIICLQIISAPPEAQKPAQNSEYELTSIISTTRKLFGMTSTPPLTKRDAWSATFEQALSLSSPRRDTPLHLPLAPPPSKNFAPEKEELLPLNDLQLHMMEVHAHLAGVTKEECDRHVRTQGHVSDWLQKCFKRHAETTQQWQDSKVQVEYEVAAQPWGANWAHTSWDVNKANDTIFNTVSLRNVPTLCLDYKGNAQSPSAGDLVGVSNCLDKNPDHNRDVAQRWVWHPDATVRPFANKRLCMTIDLLNGNHEVHLQPCMGGVEQHFAWHGPAPGEGDGGYIFFGDDTNALGVIEKKL